MLQVYPQDYSCILNPQQHKGGLFIGNLQAAQNTRTLQKHNIKAILTAAKGVDLQHSRQQITYYVQIKANDHESYDLSVHFHEAADFIREALQKTNLMVHCLAGVSRSVSLVIAYFIKYRGMSFQQAFQLVKSKRRIIHPNDGFISQLKRFQIQHKRGKRSPEFQPKSASPRRQTRTYNPHFVSTQQAGYLPRQHSPEMRRRRQVNDQEMVHHQSQYLTTRKYDKKYTYQGRQRPFYSPQKYSKQRVDQTYGRIKRLHSSRPSSTNNSYQPPLRPQPNNSKTVHIDTSQIDRKIDQIRKKYQQYSGHPQNFNRYNIPQPSTYSKSTLEKAQQVKKRSYNYLQQYERTTRKPIYSYSQY